MSWHGAVIFYSDGEGGLNTLFPDQILDNDMKQDCGAVASLIDAALSRAKREFPSLASFTLLSDDARCYQNDILPVMLPHIAQHHSLRINAFIHSETQQGKSLVDAHFALAMMQVNRYVNATRKDVCTPSAVIDAINWNGGIANTAAEVVRIGRKHPQLSKWMSSATRQGMEKLGRNNEYTYKFINEKQWEVYAYALSFRAPIKYRFSYCKSESLESQERAPSQLEVSSSSLEEHTDERNEENDSSNFVEGLSGMVQREATYLNSITGVTVWGEARIRRLRKRRAKLITPNNAITDSTNIQEAEMETIKATQEVDIDKPVFMECKKCGAYYRLERFLTEHEKKCEGNTSKTILSRALGLAMKLLNKSELSIYKTSERNPSLQDIEINDDVKALCAKKSGWASRPAYGQSLGINTVPKYRTKLKEWFEMGQKEKGKKMSAGRMRDMLKKKYPRSYDIPGEHFITRFISSQLYQYKKRHREETTAKNHNSKTNPGPIVELTNSDDRQNASVLSARPKRGVQEPYTTGVRHVLEREPSLMPRHVKRKVIDSLELNEQELPDEFPAEQALKNKLSMIKTSTKKARLP